MTTPCEMEYVMPDLSAEDCDLPAIATRSLMCKHEHLEVAKVCAKHAVAAAEELGCTPCWLADQHRCDQVDVKEMETL